MCILWIVVILWLYWLCKLLRLSSLFILFKFDRYAVISGTVHKTDSYDRAVKKKGSPVPASHCRSCPAKTLKGWIGTHSASAAACQFMSCKSSSLATTYLFLLLLWSSSTLSGTGWPVTELTGGVTCTAPLATLTQGESGVPANLVRTAWVQFLPPPARSMLRAFHQAICLPLLRFQQS